MSAAVITLRRKKLVRRFAELGATSGDKAIPFEEVGMRRSWIFDQMVSRGVFVHAGHDRFYMNEEAARTFLEAQRRRARIGGGILLVAFVVVVVVLLGLGW
jgi:cyclopropane fatty-acyl-phospholipid synthase-like methyltransferase